MSITDIVPSISQPHGGPGGGPFIDSHDIVSWGRICRIQIWTGSWFSFADILVAFKVTWENGKSFQHGKPTKAFPNSEINLHRNEKIIKVRGKTSTSDGSDYVTGITFETNKECYGPYGKGKDEFQEDFKEEALLFMFGRSGSIIDQIGFAYGQQPPSLPEAISSSPTIGYVGEYYVDGLESVKDPSSKISALEVNANEEKVNGIKVFFKNGDHVVHGTLDEKGSSKTEKFPLDDNEMLKQVMILSSGSNIKQVQFLTSTGKLSLPFGYPGTNGNRSVLKKTGSIINCFYSYADAEKEALKSLGVYYRNVSPVRATIKELVFNKDLSDIKITTPEVIGNFELFNESETEQTMEKSITVEVSSSHATSVTETSGYSFEMGFEKEFNAFFVSGKLSLSAGYSSEKSETTETSETETHSETFTFPVTVPPKSNIIVSVLKEKDEYDLPWTATAVMTYSDNETSTAELHGVLKGTQVENIRVQYSVPEENDTRTYSMMAC